MKRPACKTLEISISRATTRAEIDAAAQVYERSRRAAFPWRPEADAQAANFLRTAEEEEVFVARFGSRIVGMASFYAPENFLHSLYVDPDAQGLGVGRALVAHVRAHATGPLTLKLDAKNDKARGFYRAHGWQRMHGSDDSGVENGLAWERWRLD
ncbi:MAG: GNAT family N-acetyltransferase [Proteobacteria bacterium]|nr:GNAT family N-acetyltransferase [Pseudomonadota bacterium]